jgi:hypothetical protein
MSSLQHAQLLHVVEYALPPERSHHATFFRLLLGAAQGAPHYYKGLYTAARQFMFESDLDLFLADVMIESVCECIPVWPDAVQVVLSRARSKQAEPTLSDLATVALIDKQFMSKATQERKQHVKQWLHQDRSLREPFSWQPYYSAPCTLDVFTRMNKLQTDVGFVLSALINNIM